jgi:hypothetical protein
MSVWVLRSVTCGFLCGCLSPGSAVCQGVLGLRPFVVYPPSCRGGRFYTTELSLSLSKLQCLTHHIHLCVASPAGTRQFSFFRLIQFRPYITNAIITPSKEFKQMSKKHSSFQNLILNCTALIRKS